MIMTVTVIRIDSIEDTLKLQKYIDQLSKWARELSIRFQPVKCNMMQVARIRIKKVNAVYSLEGKVLQNVIDINIKEMARGLVPDLWPKSGTGPLAIPTGAG